MSRIAILGGFHEIESVLWQDTGPHVRELEGLTCVVSHSSRVELVEQVDQIHSELGDPVRATRDSHEAGKLAHGIIERLTKRPPELPVSGDGRSPTALL